MKIKTVVLLLALSVCLLATDYVYIWSNGKGIYIPIDTKTLAIVNGILTAKQVPGPVGPAGPAGPSGVAATVTVGTVTTSAPGTPAAVTNSGTPNAAILNFVIPQGAQGIPGISAPPPPPPPPPPVTSDPPPVQNPAPTTTDHGQTATSTPAKSLITTATTSTSAQFPAALITTATPMRLEFVYDTFTLNPSDSNSFIGVGPYPGLNQFGCRIGGGTILQCIDGIDTGAGYVQADLAGWDSAHKDYGLSVRMERDPARKLFYVTVCHADGSACVYDQVSHSTWGQTSIANADIGRVGAGPGNTALSGTLALLRFSTTLSTTTVPPNASNAVAGDIVDWEFDGSVLDSVRSSAFNGIAPAYTATPARMPVCNAGPVKTVGVGMQATLDGSGSYALDGGKVLTFSWRQTAGPAQAVLSSASVMSPAITAPVFGQYDFELVVADGSGNKGAPCNTSVGATKIDAKGNVVIANPVHAWILTQTDPANPEPGTGVPSFVDSSVVPDGTGIRSFPLFQSQLPVMARAVMTAMTAAGMGSAAEWNIALPGTVSIIPTCTAWSKMGDANCSTITGIGTHFTTDYCAGGSGSDGSMIVIWYKSLLVPGTTGRRLYPIAKCDSDIQLTLGRPAGPWSFISEPGVVDTSATSGLQYSRLTEAKSGVWYNSGATGAYYNTPAGFYYLWHATGLNWYRDQARIYADTWFTLPFLDGGSQFAPDTGWWQLGYGESRVTSLLALIMRAADGRPEMWPGIRRIARFVGPGNTRANGPVPDLRDAGIVTQWYAVLALTDPDPAERAAWYQQLKQLYPGMWTPYAIQSGTDIWWNALDTGGGTSSTGIQELQKAQGGWVYSGTANVTQGSATVAGTGTNFLTSYQWNPSSQQTETMPAAGLRNKCDYIWFTDTANSSVFKPNRDLTGDVAAYRVASIGSDSDLTLTRPYAGASGSKRYVCAGNGPDADNTIATNVQPFMLTMAANGHVYSRAAAKANNDAALQSLAEQYAVGAASFVVNRTYDAVNGGHTYFWNPTSAMPDRSEFCYTCLSANGGFDDWGGMRTNTVENATAYSILLRFRPSPELRAQTVARFGQVWGKPGTKPAYTDGRYLDAIDGYWSSPTARYVQKWFGFVAGDGANQRVLGILGQ